MKCSKNNCPNEAVGMLRVCIPAKAVPLSQHDPLRMITGLHLCADCANDFDAQSILTINPDTVAYITAYLKACNKAEADFEKAFAELAPYNDADVAELLRMRNEHESE